MRLKVFFLVKRKISLKYTMYETLSFIVYFFLSCLDTSVCRSSLKTLTGL